MNVFIFPGRRKTARSEVQDDTQPWLIAGLGNPGPKYERTWHNAGFMCLDVLSQRFDIPVRKIKFKGLYGQGSIAGQKVVLLKPATYMNNSGESIAEAASFFKIPPEKILIIYDDIDVDCGNLRIRPGGSGGTHNGMRSVIAHLGTTAFPRIRIGIGPLPDKGEIVSYVLSEVPGPCRESMSDSIRNAAGAVEEILGNGLLIGMGKYNAQRKGEGRKGQAAPADGDDGRVRRRTPAETEGHHQDE